MEKKKKKPRICLEKVLKDKGVTKYKFAQLLGKSTANVAVYFRDGYNPNFSTLVKWAEVLRCKVSDFIDE